MTSLQNHSASIHQRLLNESKHNGIPFNVILQRYANERFLVRLANSPHCDKFVLKGGMIFLGWSGSQFGPTRDIDFLAHLDNSIEIIIQIVRDICQTQVDSDGINFDAESINAATIQEQAQYPGIRLTFLANLGNARVPMQIDIGFGDAVVPDPASRDFPTILPKMQYAHLLVYPLESATAEKLETIIKLGTVNSRMKDYYDLWFISQNIAFGFELLHKAIEATLKKRNTPIPDEVPQGLREGFAISHQVHWTAFLRNNPTLVAPAEFSDLLQQLRSFLLPIFRTGARKEALWQPKSREWRVE